jgi:hypothetical protein
MNPIRSCTSARVSRATTLARRAPSARISSTCPGRAASSAARSRIGASRAAMLSARTRLHSMQPHRAPRQFTATSSTVSGGEK